jgi:hypothetical protein
MAEKQIIMADKTTHTLNIWFRAAFDAAYAPNPSSNSRKLSAEPESLDMKTMVPIGRPVASRRWAVIMGPMVLVWRWWAKLEYEISVALYHALSTGERRR